MNGRSSPARLIALVVALAVAGALAYAFSNVRKGYAPRQPIAFSHLRMAGAPVMQVNDKGEQVNVGGFGIPCLYCHTMPYKGRHSTLPSTAVCMNCHSTVGLNKEWVLKMKDYWDRGRADPVGQGPRPARLRLLRPLRAPECEGRAGARPSCRSPTRPASRWCRARTATARCEEMDIVSVQQNFNMQWCLDCHRKPEMQAPTDCITCHR